VTAEWQWDDRTISLLKRAQAAGDAEIACLLEQVAALAGERYSDRPPSAATESREPEYNDRRLSDRIMRAMDLALDQGDLTVSEHLEHAFEAVMTRFGGPNAVEKRGVPESLLRVYERLNDLRHRRLRP